MNKFDTHIGSSDSLMSVGQLKASLNMPEALRSVGEGANEHVHRLPPYRTRRAYLVDEYPACPKDWLRSNGRIKSYFVPIVENSGLWLDFNSLNNFTSVPNHVAVVVSVQGVNAITGLPCKDSQLEQYRDECPKHKKAFGPDRLCTQCGFKWPKQNYLSTTSQPLGHMWLDGFRADDGHIRQYVLTAQKARGVANAIIGEDRVHALGFSFFLSKSPRPVPQMEPMRGPSSSFSKGGGYSGLITSHKLGFCHLDTSATTSTDYETYDGPITCASAPTSFYSASATTKEFKGSQVKFSSLASPGVDAAITDHSSQYMSRSISAKKLEVAAGARVDQRIFDDPNDLEFWQKEPEGLIVVNYVTEEDAEKIIEAGKIDLSGHPEGFLQQVPVGN